MTCWYCLFEVLQYDSDILYCTYMNVMALRYFARIYACVFCGKACLTHRLIRLIPSLGWDEHPGRWARAPRPMSCVSLSAGFMSQFHGWDRATHEALDTLWTILTWFKLKRNLKHPRVHVRIIVYIYNAYNVSIYIYGCMYVWFSWGKAASTSAIEPVANSETKEAGRIPEHVLFGARDECGVKLQLGFVLETWLMTWASLHVVVWFFRAAFFQFVVTL